MKNKRLLEILSLICFIGIFMITNMTPCAEEESEEIAVAKSSITPENYGLLTHSDWREQQEEIRNEIFYGELEEVAIVVQAEAGNQDELGQRYVADVIFNRVDCDRFPDDIHEVIYQVEPVQFSTTVDGAMGKAGYEVTEEIFQLVLEEYGNRTNSEIVYFRTGHYHSCGKPAFKHGNHYFSTLGEG